MRESQGEGKSEVDIMLEKSYALLEEAAAEREEVLRHKWLESEKAGREITFEEALSDWLVHHRVTWQEKRHAESQQQPQAK
jgi:hypothetical protein